VSVGKDSQPDSEATEVTAGTSWHASIGSTDRMRWITIATCGGLVAAFVLALIGGFPLDTPMPTHSFGLVEPTCGLTRGSTAIARGNFALAWQYNPAAFLVMGFGILGLVRTLVGVTTHRWLNATWRFNRVALLLLAAAFIGLWIHQQSNAEFIINSRA
jgi:hypothetical protein